MPRQRIATRPIIPGILPLSQNFPINSTVVLESPHPADEQEREEEFLEPFLKPLIVGLFGDVTVAAPISVLSVLYFPDFFEAAVIRGNNSRVKSCDLIVPGA